MRIVAGTLRGRTVDGPKWDGLRPTSDSLRETLFNVLGPTIGGLRVLDAFAGTGAVGLEALSRGARDVTFVDADPRAIKLIEQNISKLGVENACGTIRGDFMTLSARAPFDLIFLDPPYELAGLERAMRRAAGWVVDGGRVVLEHSRRREPPDGVEAVGAAGIALTKYRTLTAGDSALSFYTATLSPAASAASET
jgi:16S rRNA (guanine966-N2)-methyltransferase